jgi:nucleoid-associated protein YgaU
LASRLALILGAVGITSLLPSAGSGQQCGRRLALALSPAWARPAVALLLTAGVTATGAGCTRSGGYPELAGRHGPREPFVTVVTVSCPSGPAPSPPTRVDPGPGASITAKPALSSGVARSGTDPPVAAVTASVAGRAGAVALDAGAVPWATTTSSNWLSRGMPQADPGQPPDPAWSSLPQPGWVPDSPPAARRLSDDDAFLVTSGARRPADLRHHRSGSAEHRVVVHRGDSLWSIAARHLGPGASDAEVAERWPRWWHVNRSVIGPDPNLLLPGMRLKPPRLTADSAPISRAQQNDN